MDEKKANIQKGIVTLALSLLVVFILIVILIGNSNIFSSDSSAYNDIDTPVLSSASSELDSASKLLSDNKIVNTIVLENNASGKETGKVLLVSFSDCQRASALLSEEYANTDEYTIYLY